MIDCASVKFYRRCQDCKSEDHCVVRRMMLEVRNAIHRVLDKRSLAEMRALGSLGADELTYDI